MVNLLDVNGRLIVPDPKYEPLRQAFRDALPGEQIVFIDCIEYHRGVGEAHCSANTKRTPGPTIQKWWEHQPPTP